MVSSTSWKQFTPTLLPSTPEAGSLLQPLVEKASALNADHIVLGGQLAGHGYLLSLVADLGCLLVC